MALFTHVGIRFEKIFFKCAASCNKSFQGTCVIYYILTLDKLEPCLSKEGKVLCEIMLFILDVVICSISWENIDIKTKE